MGKVRHLIVLAALALALPASAAAEAPQLYIGSGPDYTVAFKAEGTAVSVLALNAPIYCTFTHPRERFPGTMYMFQGPTLMREGRRGFEAPLRPAAGPPSYIDARFQDGRLAGTFALDQNERSADCQTADYLPANPAVKFEAVSYEPVSSGAAKPPAKGEIPIYYGSESGLEVFLETIREDIDFRGAAPAACPVSGKQPAGQRVPLFGDIEAAERHPDGGFHRLVRRSGQIAGRAWSEATTVTGAVEGGTISGTYLRTTTTKTPKGPPLQCKVGPLPFRAVRYLPAKG
jgi:hypothetical protein